MWLLTTAGFYSIVEKPWDRPVGTLTVRARVRADLERFREIALASPDLARSVASVPIVEDRQADYRFRIQLPAVTVMMVAAKLVQEIDYPNFKAAAAGRLGHERAAIYARVWSLLTTLATLDPISHLERIHVLPEDRLRRGLSVD